MVAIIQTIALTGIHAENVDVQVQLSPGLPAFNIVGLPDGAVRESKERVRGAFHALGMALPAKRITVNLSPADITKEGNHYDLPIAVGLLCVLGVIEKHQVERTVFMGELGLDGSVRDIRGALPAAIHALSQNNTIMFVPKGNGHEAAWADGITVFSIQTLQEVISHLKEETLLPATAPKNILDTEMQSSKDFKDVRGQEMVKRAAEIAAAGGHNMLMCGPPGSGKSMIAQRIPTILPDLDAEEALDVSMVHSVAGMLNETGIVMKRPFRDPHHSASAVALCGGGHKAKPGEMSLSHRGVLFLDELPEFPRNVLETLRQPLETGDITISRANNHITYPAKFQLIAAMNPSPCGYLGHPSIPCTSTPKQIQSYRSKISGPLMDRIDIHVDVPVVDLKDLSLPPAKEGSQDIKHRVVSARNKQNKRFSGKIIRTNSEMSTQEIDAFCQLSEDGYALIHRASEKYALSARAYHRLLKVARTIADLADSENIQKDHLAEALSYRYIPYKS